MAKEENVTAVILAIIALLVALFGVGYTILDNSNVDFSVVETQIEKAEAILQTSINSLSEKVNLIETTLLNRVSDLEKDIENIEDDLMILDDLDEDDLEDLHDYAKDLNDIDDNKDLLEDIISCAHNATNSEFRECVAGL